MARAPAKPAKERSAPAAPRRRSRQPAQATTPQPVPPPAPPDHARSPRRRISLPTLESGSTRLRKVVLNIAFVLAILVFIPVLASQFLRNPVLIEPISVPKALLQRGLSPEVMASRLWDGLRDASLLARTSKESVAAIPNSQRVQFSVPEVGLSIDSIVRQTRQFFNAYQTRITGEFVCGEPACPASTMRLRLRILRNTSEVIDLPPVGSTDLRSYFTGAAVQVLSTLDPFVAISAIAETEPARATALARRLIRQHHPDSKWAHNLIGNIRTNSGDYRPALAEYRAALALDPGFTIARANAARALRQLGDPVASQAEYDRLAAESPNLPAVFEGYAELAIAAGQPDDGIAFLEQAAAADPTSAHYFSRIGEVEQARGDQEAAIAAFEKALAIDPAYPLALNPMFTARLARGDFSGGEELLRRAAAYDPQSPEVQALHGAALVFMGEQAQALEAFERALLVKPDDVDLLYQSANILQNLDRHADAIARLDRAITLAPYDPAPRFSRATSLMLTGNNEAALADFRRVLELDTSGTQYGSMAQSFGDIIEGLIAAETEKAAAAETGP